MDNKTCEVRDYLNHLTVLKKSIEKPISLEIDGELYVLKDGNGLPFLSCTKEIYKIFQEL